MDRIRIVVPVEHQDRYEFLDALVFSLFATKTFQQGFQTGRPPFPPLPDRTRIMKGLWTLGNQFRIMERFQLLFIVAVQARMGGQALSVHGKFPPDRRTA